MFARWFNVNSLTRQHQQRAGTFSETDATPLTTLAKRTTAPANADTISEIKQHRRTIWLSDVHLGTPECQAEQLIDFLAHNPCDTLYLVGDIVDGWQLSRSFYWNDAHNHVIQTLLATAQAATKVIYIPGNHDEPLRNYCGLTFGGIDIAFEAVHETADGKKYLVMHGDYFDGIVKYARWLAILGDWTYNGALKVNRWVNVWRNWRGKPYWSLAAWLKRHAKFAREYIGNYQHAVAGEARKRKLDGVICGHIHYADTKMIDGIHYCNDGDWVESCTALTEDSQGNIELVHWPSQKEFLIQNLNAKKKPLTVAAE